MVAISLSSKLGENLIRNPLLDIWQRGISFIGIGNDGYFADRFVYGKVGSMIHDINRSTDVPIDSLAAYSAFLNVTTAQPVLGVGDTAVIQQRVEGFNLRKIKGKNIFMSFRVKSSKTGIHCASFRNNLADRSYIVEYTVNSANTWETKVIRLKHDPSGTWEYDNGIGIRVGFTLCAGTNLHTSPDQWQNGNFLSTANQVNLCDSINNEFRVTQLQLHEGLDEIPFHKLMRTFDEEVIKCQRYYEKSYDIDVDPGTDTLEGMAYFRTIVNPNERGIGASFKVRKRSTPVATTYSKTGVINQVTSDPSSGANSIAANIQAISEGAIAVLINTGSNSGISYHYTLDAEL